MKNVVHGICKTLVASFLALGALLPSQATDAIRRGIYNEQWGYIVTSNYTVTIKAWLGGTNYIDEVVVPGVIEGLPVTRIENWANWDLKPDPWVPDWRAEYIEHEAFLDCTSITNVVFPNSLTGLEEHAFRGCDFIEEVTFGTGLKTITGANFNSKPRLRKITIPEGVEAIAGGAFKGCSVLPEVVFPDSLNDPGYWSFMDCPSITNIVIGKNGGMAYVRDSVFSADKMLDLDTVTINGDGRAGHQRRRHDRNR